MSTRPTVHNSMRVYHRYLGFFLAGIMAIYALSGVVMIFRNTDFLKRGQQMSKKVDPGLKPADLGRALRAGEIKVDRQQGDTMFFKQGYYVSSSGEAKYSVKVLPAFIQKLSKLHKASTGDSLFYLNVFFGVSLLFFVISSFWMFMPKTSIFKKGMLFTLAGIILTLIMLFV